jgi:hypothetical protein
MSNEIPRSITLEQAESFGMLNRDSGSLGDLQGDRERVRASYCDCRLARVAARKARGKELSRQGWTIQDGSRGMVRVDAKGCDTCPFCGHYLFWKTRWVPVAEGHVSTKEARELQVRMGITVKGAPSAGRVNKSKRVGMECK